MNSGVVVLILEAVSVYLLVLAAHSLRYRAGLGPFYALLGGITAVMSWVTDAGVQVEAAGITFMVGSTVFYTALLLGVFVMYVFDGPPSTRIAILTVAGVSTMVPVIAAVLHVQMSLSAQIPLSSIPVPSLRVNTASVLTTVADLIFLAIAWEFLGSPKLRLKTWLRAYGTLLGVMWLDVVLFASGAFAGTPHYLNIMMGTLLSRLIISVLAFPFLYAYLNWQDRKMGAVIENRPVLTILHEVTQVRAELDLARKEIERRKRAEQALRDSEERYRSVMDTADDMIILHSMDGHITYANRAALKNSGYTLDEALDLNVFDVVAPDLLEAAQDRLITRQERHGEVMLYESAFVDRTGQRVPIEVSSSLVLREGKPAEVLVMARDIRERQSAAAERDRLMAQLLEAQKMEAVGQLASGIAHDFNNLLTTINGYAELIQHQAPDETAIRTMAGKIMIAGERAAGLVRQMLAFAHNQRIQPRVVDLSVVVGESLGQRADRIADRIQVNTELQPDLWPLLVDLEQVNQLVDSLLCHVFDAVPPGGQVAIGTNNTSLSEDHAVQHPDAVPGDYVMLTISHSGPPLDDSIRHRIFEPFFFTSDAVADGVGLRLAAVYGIVKQNHGHIIVDSPLDKGTRYRVFLPRAPRS